MVAAEPEVEVREILCKQDTPNNSYYRQMALGHLRRKGHPFEAHLVWYKGDAFFHLVRTCCGED